MKLRIVSENDAAALLGIYAQYIDTPVSFECTLPSAEEFAARIREISRDYPYLVCDEKGKPIGYAYAHRQMERAAYGWNAELSVYIDGGRLSEGIGKKLYAALTEILQLQNVVNVYGGVTLPNARSEGLHVSAGFSRSGVYRRTGFKNGAWHDVAWFEKAIAPHTPPRRFKSMRSIDGEAVAAILRRFSD